MNKGTKIFGINIPVSQNVLAAILIPVVLVALFFAFKGNGGDDSDATAPASVAPAPGVTRPAPTRKVTTAARRRESASNKNKQSVLKVSPVDPSAMVDPTLQLALLDRVRAVKLGESNRNLFDLTDDPAAAPKNLPQIPKVAAMPPKPVGGFTGPMQPPPKPPPTVNIPFRYYGFVKPHSKADGNRGYFMDGDQILMATEGDVLKSRFLVVALSPNVARVEDIQLKMGQDLQLIPEAVVTQ